MKSIQTLVFLIITTLFTLVSVAQNRPNSYTPKAKTVYQISIPKPQTHYIEVEMSLSDIDDNFSKSEGYIDFKMPVWTPGSYLIREYAKNVEHFMAFSGSNNVKAEKINKNTWRVKYEGQKDLTVKYGVYAYELSVRTSFVDNAHAYLNGASVFLFNPQFKKYPSKLKINLPSIFSQITTGLSKTVQTNVYDVVDFDNLVDCPIEIGNQKIFNFEANKIPHQVAMYGEVKFDSVKLKTDMKKVCETASKVIGEHPCQDYFFIVHNVTQGGGGLEHKNSTTLGVSRNAYATEASYNSFLSLVAHEYFHLWNVKRIRPIALGPFDYENENYTHNQIGRAHV